MTMILKSYTVSNEVTGRREVDGHETARTIHSTAGVRAELLLLANTERRIHNEPVSMTVSVSVEIDSPPNLSGSDMTEWLREHLVAMLADRTST